MIVSGTVIVIVQVVVMVTAIIGLGICRVFGWARWD